MLLINDFKNGRFGNGFMGEVFGNEIDLCVNVNGLEGFKNGGGIILILCSGIEENKFVIVIYMISIGGKENYMVSSLMLGGDKWKFGVIVRNIVSVSGFGDSRYVVYYNREEFVL